MKISPFSPLMALAFLAGTPLVLSQTASPAPSSAPTLDPSPVPSIAPTPEPSPAPSGAPTVSPRPSLEPSSAPSGAPTVSTRPSLGPSHAPSGAPTVSPRPSQEPSSAPSGAPTVSTRPSLGPSSAPSDAPTVSLRPSLEPSSAPSSAPTPETPVVCPQEYNTTVPLPTSLPGGLVLSYSARPDTNDPNGGMLCVRLVYGGEAWLGFGRSEFGGMVGSEVVVGKPLVTNAAERVRKYDINFMASAGVEPMPPESQTLLDATIVRDAEGVGGGSTTTLSFAKLLNETGELEIVAGQQNRFVWAVGNSDEFGYHADRGSIDLTGEPTLPPTPRPTTARPTSNPTPEPTRGPTAYPTHRPTFAPTVEPTPPPTDPPTPVPTDPPTPGPTILPKSATSCEPERTCDSEAACACPDGRYKCCGYDEWTTCRRGQIGYCVEIPGDWVEPPREEEGDNDLSNRLRRRRDTLVKKNVKAHVVGDGVGGVVDPLSK